MATRRGYVVTAESDRTAAICDEAAAVHRELGIASRAMTQSEIRARIPILTAERLKAALMFEAGGTVPHHAFMKGLEAACRARGVRLRYFTRVTGFDRQGERIAGVVVGTERIAAEATVIAAGAHSPAVAALAGVELEGRPWRLEASAIEPTRASLGPALSMLDRTVYVHQTARGEIVGGCEVHGDAQGLTLRSDLPVLAHYARHLVETMPSLAHSRVLRQWAGHIHATADFAPLLGPHPDARDLWISAGWSYGVMGAPAAGELLAKAIVTGAIDDRMAPFAVDRKRHGRPIREAAIVVSD